jgi:hypothetical protein
MMEGDNKEWSVVSIAIGDRSNFWSIRTDLLTP